MYALAKYVSLRFGLVLCHGLAEAREDQRSSHFPADGAIGLGGSVVQIEGLLIGKTTKLEEIDDRDFREDGGVVDISDIRVVEDVIGIFEAEGTCGKDAIKEREG